MSVATLAVMRPSPRPVGERSKSHQSPRPRIPSTRQSCRLESKLILALAWLIPTKTAIHLITDDHSPLNLFGFPSMLSIFGYKSPVITAKQERICEEQTRMVITSQQI